MAFLATVMLAVRTGDSAPIPRTAVLDAHASREPPTSSAADQAGAVKSSANPRATVTIVTTSTTLTLETLPAVPDSTSLVTPTTGPAAASTTSTTAAHSTTTTAAAPRDVTEESDNTAEYVWNKDGADTATTTPDSQPPTDPLTFLVSAQVDQHSSADNVADLDAKLKNNTDKPITFPGPDGFLLRFLIDHDGQPWRTVLVRRDDIQTLPPHSTIEVIGQVYMDPQGYGTYDVGGEINVRYS